MAAFGAKRKPRIIKAFDDDDEDLSLPLSSGGEDKQAGEELPPPARIKFGRTKFTKSSALRKNAMIGNDDTDSPNATSARDDDDDDENSGAPVVVRPSSVNKGSLSKIKKRPAASRLSFGPSAGAEDDDEEAEVVIQPRKMLNQRAVENSALRANSSLPTRFGGEENRPKYSKEYLAELQSATFNTPQNLADLKIHDDDEMQLDEMELEGALIVPSNEVAVPGASTTQTTHIPTEAEIRERKERRARLAHEAKFIPLDDEFNSDNEGAQPSHPILNLPSKQKRRDTRLIREDEDLYEGFDEFVSDGNLALGRKAEKAVLQRHRQEMAELIEAAQAEDNDEAASDDSEAEERAAYEEAQVRAAMDGLRGKYREEHLERGGGADLYEGRGPDDIPRMKPLPKLGDVLQRIREAIQGLEGEVVRKRSRIEGLEKEKAEILVREKEVQEILNQAGQKYQEVVGGLGVHNVPKIVAGQSPLRPFPPGLAREMPTERGLESYGATPIRRYGGEEDDG
ncbi:uncharacterized protein CTHT_0074550 [Thermochaetoides thermophila DSM 1495]|uniref:Nineteen complex-related protein 2-domain-containing protein n=1 Tax=Chaetomium thermophilum (strain DSM 1495 / CBS 144.50 / IMI 039719) TaxID=759272 RepID=G0SI54_CHATD|nr:hypothetical protein CTHT_0074550 [Thermochaetoides thermophila DSM 1495]EGS17124.1 hypothetical protein CTHT_0074550 [Thermochaetoides thermophila DSM 1495]